MANKFGKWFVEYASEEQKDSMRNQSWPMRRVTHDEVLAGLIGVAVADYSVEPQPKDFSDAVHTVLLNMLDVTFDDAGDAGEEEEAIDVPPKSQQQLSTFLKQLMANDGAIDLDAGWTTSAPHESVFQIGRAVFTPDGRVHYVAGDEGVLPEPLIRFAARALASHSTLKRYALENCCASRSVLEDATHIPNHRGIMVMRMARIGATILLNGYTPGGSVKKHTDKKEFTYVLVVAQKQGHELEINPGTDHKGTITFNNGADPIIAVSFLPRDSIPHAAGYDGNDGGDFSVTATLRLVNRRACKDSVVGSKQEIASLREEEGLMATSHDSRYEGDAETLIRSLLTRLGFKDVAAKPGLPLYARVCGTIAEGGRLPRSIIEFIFDPSHDDIRRLRLTHAMQFDALRNGQGYQPTMESADFRKSCHYAACEAFRWYVAARNTEPGQYMQRLKEIEAETKMSSRWYDAMKQDSGGWGTSDSWQGWWKKGAPKRARWQGAPGNCWIREPGEPSDHFRGLEFSSADFMANTNPPQQRPLGRGEMPSEERRTEQPDPKREGGAREEGWSVTQQAMRRFMTWLQKEDLALPTVDALVSGGNPALERRPTKEMPGGQCTGYVTV
eukprot:gene22016-31624_t